MTAIPHPSHITHVIPLAWAMRAAGHEVIVAGQPDLASTVESAGLGFARVGEAYHTDDLVLRQLKGDKRLVELAGLPTPQSLMMSARMWQIHARYLLSRYLEFAQWWKPDLVISDRMEFAGPMVAAALGVPSVHHRLGPDTCTDRAHASAPEYFEAACRRMGLDGYAGPTVVVDPCPPELQMPGVVSDHLVRHVPFNGSGKAPDWARRRNRPRRVCVSLGNRTLLFNGVPLQKHVIEAFQGMDDVEVIVTAAAEFHEAIGELPENVRLVDTTPLNLFLDSCDLLVSHGGPGTALTACGLGVPQLVLPQWIGHPEMGTRLAAYGAGLTIEDAAEQDDPAVVREAVRTLLEEERFHKAARDLADSMAAQQSPAELVPVLEQLTR
ncbi:nucleotide disphospho-sugar-binding domain-containing protein [Streptomyces sp. NPDC052396]|uniref:nucleotide disphospho-sugar-binding domain-containing protein n=1 Tax=Streptomyces sp. NPDC052396 TaxID=3365689 RepID=UPI0037D42E3E